MKLSLLGRLLSTCVLGVATLVSSSVIAETNSYPNKTIQFIVPYPPGGPLDTMARLLAEKVKDDLGTVVVQNKSGAGGNIGAGLAASAQPDGYTLVMGAVAINAINPWLYPSLPFDPVKSFEPVSLVASVPNVLIVNTNFAEANNIASVADLVTYAKANPSKLNFASGGNGSAGHLAGELFNSRQDIQTVHVPYGGAAPAKTSLLGGEVDFMFDNLASALPLIESKRVVALAVTTADRSSFLADTPTMQEAGVDNFDLGTWFGVFATGGTPEPIVQTLNTAYVKALNDPEIRRSLELMGSDAKPTSVQEFKELVTDDLAKYKEIVEASGAQLF